MAMQTANGTVLARRSSIAGLALGPIHTAGRFADHRVRPLQRGECAGNEFPVAAEKLAGREWRMVLEP